MPLAIVGTAGEKSKKNEMWLLKNVESVTGNKQFQRHLSKIAAFTLDVASCLLSFRFRSFLISFFTFPCKKNLKHFDDYPMSERFKY